jgi:hypothetical protein
MIVVPTSRHLVRTTGSVPSSTTSAVRPSSASHGRFLDRDGQQVGLGAAPRRRPSVGRIRSGRSHCRPGRCTEGHQARSGGAPGRRVERSSRSPLRAVPTGVLLVTTSRHESAQHRSSRATGGVTLARWQDSGRRTRASPRRGSCTRRFGSPSSARTSSAPATVGSEEAEAILACERVCDGRRTATTLSRLTARRGNNGRRIPSLTP